MPNFSRDADDWPNLNSYHSDYLPNYFIIFYWLSERFQKQTKKFCAQLGVDIKSVSNFIVVQRSWVRLTFNAHFKLQQRKRRTGRAKTVCEEKWSQRHSSTTNPNGLRHSLATRSAENLFYVAAKIYGCTARFDLLVPPPRKGCTASCLFNQQSDRLLWCQNRWLGVILKL